MDRRKFLKVGGMAAAIVLPAAGAVSVEEYRMDRSMRSGHAVGQFRPSRAPRKPTSVASPNVAETDGADFR